MTRLWTPARFTEMARSTPPQCSRPARAALHVVRSSACTRLVSWR